MARSEEMNRGNTQSRMVSSYSHVNQTTNEDQIFPDGGVMESAILGFDSARMIGPIEDNTLPSNPVSRVSCVRQEAAQPSMDRVSNKKGDRYGDEDVEGEEGDHPWPHLIVVLQMLRVAPSIEIKVECKNQLKPKEKSEWQRVGKGKEVMSQVTVEEMVTAGPSSSSFPVTQRNEEDVPLIHEDTQEVETALEEGTAP
ncbi:hypothetical protein U1Q18_003458 [Sarracenia purpurea var. burkii]